MEREDYWGTSPSRQGSTAIGMAEDKEPVREKSSRLISRKQVEEEEEEEVPHELRQ
ncbi:GD18386 [Drosophila simulans]|uniref:GD18386 n=1 Tax=Drosophila simulans TaxID=7240 RepID=B4R1G6_DROSI|nr:GD18386 [Drosophila simulans]